MTRCALLTALRVMSLALLVVERRLGGVRVAMLTSDADRSRVIHERPHGEATRADDERTRLARAIDFAGVLAHVCPSRPPSRTHAAYRVPPSGTMFVLKTFGIVTGPLTKSSPPIETLPLM